MMKQRGAFSKMTGIEIPRVGCNIKTMSRGQQFGAHAIRRHALHHFASQIIDLLLVLLAAWMVLAIIFAIYAYFARRARIC